MTAIVEQIVSEFQGSLRDEGHPRAFANLVSTRSIGCDGRKEHIADFCCQFLEMLSPCCDCLISRAYKIIDEDDCVVAAESFTHDLTSTDEQRSKLRGGQVVRESKIMEHSTATFAPTRRELNERETTTTATRLAMPAWQTCQDRSKCGVDFLRTDKLDGIQKASGAVAIGVSKFPKPSIEASLGDAVAIPLKALAPCA